jgi:predicted dehydrogenase
MTQRVECKVAIVGAGNMAREHIRAFMDVSGVKLAGIQSRTRARAASLAAEFKIPIIAESVAELYERTGAALAVISVSETSTREVCDAAFGFPWTVLIEKPPGYNLQEAERIEQAALTRTSPVLVALNRRFHSSTRTVLDQLNEFAGPRFIQVQDQQSLAEAAAYNLHPLVIENLMYANSIHLIDYLSLFGRGELTSVTPVIRWNEQEPGVVVSAVEFSSGDAGLYTGIWNGPGPWAVAVNTPERRWEMRPLEQVAFQNRGERKLSAVAADKWDTEFKPGFRLQAEMAVTAALGLPSDSPTLSEAMKTMRLIHRIFS